MCAAVENTDASGEGDIDPHDDFEQWLKSQKASQSLITKITQFGMDIEMLEEIDVNDKQELNNLAKDMNLSSAERLKFRVILKNIPRQKLNNVIYPEERKAILEMERKLKDIQQSMTNIDDVKQNIENEVEKCRKLITTTYDDIVNKVIARKESVLAQLKEIANNKFANLDKVYEEMKANSAVASSHIRSCYTAINKNIDLNTIDQRKQNILDIAENVEKMDVIDTDNPLIKNCNIDFGCNSEQVIDIINKSGHFVSIPVPILVLVQSVFGKVKIQWKLDNVDAEKRAEVNKLKVEWSDTETKQQDDENYDDLKIDWNFNKIIDVHNIDNDNNETEIAEFIKSGDYLLRLQCMIDDKLSKYSNIKPVSIKKVHDQARFVWTHKYKNGAQFSENGTRIKSRYTGNSWVCVSSSTGWNSGKYFWKIKLNARCGHAYDGVGVTTDYEGVSQDTWLSNVGTSAYYYAYDNYIYNNKKGEKQVDRWKPGDIITINLDCDAWKIKFDLNDKDWGTFDLVPNQTYYPAVQMIGLVGYDLKLLQ